jgi:hypothetical protein
MTEPLDMILHGMLAGLGVLSRIFSSAKNLNLQYIFAQK